NACTSWGFLHEQGRGVTVDLARAVELYRKGCDGGNAQGCHNLGVLYEAGRGVSGDLGQAATFYDQACQKGLADACNYRSGVLNTLRATCPDAPDGGKKPAKLDASGC